MATILHHGPLTARIREAWLDRDNRRLSAGHPDWTERPTVHAIVVESVSVEEAHRREGHCKRFLADICANECFEMAVVEGVQNPVLADALLRWGWEVDSGVMDFYWPIKGATA